LTDVWNTIQNMQKVVKCLEDDTGTDVFVDYDWAEGETPVAKTILRIKRTPYLLSALLDELIKTMPPEELPFTDPPEVELGRGEYVLDA
jgi:hypothetical protein